MANNLPEIIRQMGEAITPHDFRIVELVAALEELSHSTSDIKILRTYLSKARGYLEECINEAEKRFEEEAYNGYNVTE